MLFLPHNQRVTCVNTSRSTIARYYWSEGFSAVIGMRKPWAWEPPPHQVGGSHGDWPGQKLQGTATQRANPHPAAPTSPQQGCWTWAAWVLDSCLERQWRLGQSESFQQHPFMMQFPVTADDEMHCYNMSAHASFFSFTLKKTRASGRNVSKVQTLLWSSW